MNILHIEFQWIAFHCFTTSKMLPLLAIRFIFTGLCYLLCSESFRIPLPVRGIRLYQNNVYNLPSLYCEKKKIIDIYENEEIIVDLDDTEYDLALETFKELALNSNSVSIQAFLEWDDIKDVMSRGFIDEETIGIIMKELGIKSGFLEFSQFKEMVEMINHVNAALEQNEALNDEDDDDDEGNYSNDDDSFFPPSESGDDDDTMKWLEKQLKS